MRVALILGVLLILAVNGAAVAPATEPLRPYLTDATLALSVLVLIGLLAMPGSRPTRLYRARCCWLRRRSAGQGQSGLRLTVDIARGRSNFALNFEKPEIGRLPLVVLNRNSPLGPRSCAWCCSGMILAHSA
jgi:hypothetical protein